MWRTCVSSVMMKCTIHISSAIKLPDIPVALIVGIGVAMAVNSSFSEHI